VPNAECPKQGRGQKTKKAALLKSAHQKKLNDSDLLMV
jgi:hypothetical protein